MSPLNLKPEQSNIFFKLIEERYHRHSTIITTNLLCGAPHNRFNAESIFMRSESTIAYMCASVGGKAARAIAPPCFTAAVAQRR